ncbi:hypothetical protein [Bradyrhizobium sp. Ash2021]|uniref:hypothetical protein n=1 Tax=Bradyrhizobium sp. Ash2021 TaxID=2954771 RepID=UPI0035BEE688
MNPKGRVPALQTGKGILSESPLATSRRHFLRPNLQAMPTASPLPICRPSISIWPQRFTSLSPMSFARPVTATATLLQPR